MFLHDERRNRIFEVPPTGARLGRDPEVEMAFPDEESLMSAVHCRVYPKPDEGWWIEDLGSTNGTFVQGERLTAPRRLRSGDRFTLGQRGPALAVNIPGEVKRTQAERPIDVSRPLLRLRRVKGGQDLIGNGSEIVLGRGSNCTIPLRTVADTVISKHHAVVEIHAGGLATIRDLGSKNGTWVNGQQVTADLPLAVGDRIMLGWHGPLFEVRILGAAMLPEGEGAAYRPQLQPAKTFGGMVDSARDAARAEAGARSGTFLKALAAQMLRESSALFRLTVLTALVLLVVAVGYVWRVALQRSDAAEQELIRTRQQFTAQLRRDSVAQAESSAEIARLRRALATARRGTVNRAVIDSLSRRLAQAEAAAARPVSGSAAPDFARVATENQRAVGLVIARFGTDSVMGSGFAITRSGYFVTNKHVVFDRDRPALRAIDITMADTRTPLQADVVAISTIADQDIAVLKIRNYRGEAVRAIDWNGRGAQQGAPAAIIGFPGGTELAVDQSGFVRTSFFAGVISKAAGDWLQFGGTTFSGASGSPIFNAAGEVIAVHFGGYRGGQGIGFSVPVPRVRRWLPAEARAELGL